MKWATFLLQQDKRAQKRQRYKEEWQGRLTLRDGPIWWHYQEALAGPINTCMQQQQARQTYLMVAGRTCWRAAAEERRGGRERDRERDYKLLAARRMGHGGAGSRRAQRAHRGRGSRDGGRGRWLRRRECWSGSERWAAGFYLLTCPSLNNRAMPVPLGPSAGAHRPPFQGEGKFSLPQPRRRATRAPRASFTRCLAALPGPARHGPLRARDGNVCVCAPLSSAAAVSRLPSSTCTGGLCAALACFDHRLTHSSPANACSLGRPLEDCLNHARPVHHLSLSILVHQIL